MATKSTEELKTLGAMLGIELGEGSEIVVSVGKDGLATKKRSLRIRSLGTQSYDIWSADLTTESVTPVTKTAGKDLVNKLQDVLGVPLEPNAEIVINVAEDQTQKTARSLRLRSLGADAYDIWSANFTAKVSDK